jgi:hypothetical protein
MNTQTCYSAVFNVGEVDVWSSELYLDKEAIFAELEESKEKIADCIDTHSDDYCFDCGDEPDKPMLEMLERAFAGLRKEGRYIEKDTQLDFFILSNNIYQDRQDCLAKKRRE